MNRTRTLAWPNCYNIRDLGGLPTDSGHLTRVGAVVRSDLPARLTVEGQRALLGYGIRTIIDLRRSLQVTTEPSLVFAPEIADPLPTLYNISLEEHGAAVDEAIRQAGNRREEVYLLTLQHNQRQVARILQTIAAAPPGGILIHCSAGKDRTGIVTALLLSLVGVPDAIIADDYALSQQQLWPLYERLVEEAGGEDHVGWWLKPTATPAMMRHVLDELRSNYGGVVEYLRQAGVSATMIAQIRARLLTT
ncbi:MAG: tyrosine-protein phosphatase [Caldilineaceae bacterium]|nr:tyrosine-protein phosphatase [Caldilineaceae bacterium]